jgi:hypothetical protein
MPALVAVTAMIYVPGLAGVVVVVVVVVGVVLPLPLPPLPPPVVLPPDDDPALTLLLQPIALRAAIDRKTPSREVKRRRRGSPKNKRPAIAMPPPVANRCI